MALNGDGVPAGLPDGVREAVEGLANVIIHPYDAGHAFARTQHRADHYVPATPPAGRRSGLFGAKKNPPRVNNRGR